MEAYIGSVFAFGFNFAPVGWQLCDGTLLPISGNEALYAVIGTTYGGDGMSTFAVPDLRGRVPVGQGQGQGLSPYMIGQKSGGESITLTSANLAPHNHTATATIAVGTGSDSDAPATNYFGTADGTTGNVYGTPSDGTHMGSNTGNTQATGGNQPVEIITPYQAINYCICTAGQYPTQS